MTEAYVGEVRLFGGNFPPVGWLDCNGALVSIASYETLYTLIGTTYGGDGQTTFGLPALRGRVPVGQGQGPGLSGYTMGQQAGAEGVQLLTTNLPNHAHVMQTGSSGATASPSNAYLATAQSDQSGVRLYSTTNATTTALGAQSIGIAGGSQPHTNMQPYLAIRYIICTDGIFPSRQ